MSATAVKLALKREHIRLNLGSGVGLLKNFINVDILPYAAIEEGWRTKKGVCANALIEPGARYEQASITKLPFADNYAEYVIMQEVLEHLPIRLVQTAVNEVYRVMQPGALLVITTPDFNNTAKWWLEVVGSKVGKFKDFDTYRYLAEILYGNQQHDGEFHRCPMTPDFVNFVLRVAGFKKENIKVEIWTRHSKPARKYAGMIWKRGAVMRTDTIVAEVVK